MKDNYADPEFHRANPTYLFAVGVFLGALSTFSRADYNLPMFAFLLVMWNQDDNEKPLIQLLLVLTTIVDVLWLLFWVPHYHTKELEKLNYGLHMMVAIVSIIEIVLKVIIFFVLFASRANNKQAGLR